MELRQLSHFIAILENGSLAKAAAQVGLTQQALSKSLERLEADLGAPLFERTARGMLPTAFGRALSDHARGVLAEAGRLEHAAKTMRGLDRGRIVVGLSPIAAIGPIGQAVIEFAKAHPHLRVAVEAGIDRQFSRAILAGEIDFAVASVTEPRDTAIQTRVLHEEEWLVVGSKGNVRLSRAKSLRDLAGMCWLMGRNTEALSKEIHRDFRLAGLEQPAPSMTTTSVMFALKALAESDWLSILPASLIAADPRLRGARFGQANWRTPLTLMMRRTSRPDDPARRFSEQLK